MLIKAVIVITAIVSLFSCAMLSATKADARTHRRAAEHYSHYVPGAKVSHHPQHRRHTHASKKKYKSARYRKRLDANGNRAAPVELAPIQTAIGLKALVVASAQDKFQRLVNLIEENGPRIRSIGCYSPRGHSGAWSKHRWGGACDLDQRSRDRAAPYNDLQTDNARSVGLVDGGTWRGRGRFGGSDRGHYEVPGPNSRYKNQFALASSNIRLAHR